MPQPPTSSARYESDLLFAVFDAHCHISINATAAAAFSAEDKALAPSGRLLCGVSPGDWPKIAQAATRDPTVVPGFGLHPWEIAGAAADWLSELEKRLTANPGAWLAEAGLDKIKTSQADFSLQQRVLARQLELADKLNRPCSLHCVRAWEELLPLLDKHCARSRKRFFVMHAFAGPAPYVKAFAERGAYFSLGTAVLDETFRRQREAAAAIPEEALLIESDAYVEKPADGLAELQAILARLARIRSVPPSILAERILANSRRIFLERE